MSTQFDNFMALRVLYMLVTPFEKTDAYKLGVIDKDGSLLVKAKDQSFEQKETYTYLDRMVFNLKRLLAKVPGGKSVLGSMVAALYLIKEDTKINEEELEIRFNEVLHKILEHNLTLVEEELAIEEFLTLLSEDGGMGGAPANVTGAAVSTDRPVIKTGKKGRRYGTFEVAPDVLRRFAKGKKKFTKWSEYLDISDPKQKEVYHYAKKNPKGVLVLKAGDNMKAIRYNRNGGGKWHKLQRKGKRAPELQVENL
jgi:hypothetical protein